MSCVPGTLSKSDIPRVARELTPAVNAYLMARAYAELEREKVGAIESEILAGKCFMAKGSRGIPVARITEPKYSWMMADEDFHEYLTLVRHGLEAAGYVIQQSPHDTEYWSYYCPALSAESLQTDCEHLLVDQAAELLNAGEDFRHTLICSGLDNYHKFVDLCIKFVVNSPGYRKPVL